jgi:hypothetical protein
VCGWRGSIRAGTAPTGTGPKCRRGRPRRPSTPPSRRQHRHSCHLLATAREFRTRSRMKAST